MRRHLSLPLWLVWIYCATACQGTLPIITASIEELPTPPLLLAEGPTWDGQDALYFTDIYANTLYLYQFSLNQTSVVLRNTDAANGMVMDSAGWLWLCRQAQGRIVRFNPVSGEQRPVVTEYAKVRFNHPNDLSLDQHGGAYFTDPAWDPVKHQKQPLNGVYYVDNHGQATLLIRALDKPNGILLSRDGHSLFVVDMATDAFMRYPVTAPGQLGEGQPFAQLATHSTGHAAPDGIEEDIYGNIFVATDQGLQVFSANAEPLGIIELPQRPTNMEFINRENTEMAVTSANHLFKLRFRQPF